MTGHESSYNVSSSDNSGLGLCSAYCVSEIGGEGRVEISNQDGRFSSSDFVSCCSRYNGAPVSTMIVEEVAEPVLDIGTGGVKSDFALGSW